MIVSVVVMVILAGLLAWGISQWFNNVETLKTVNIGIVFPEDSEETDMIMGLVEQMESVASVCTFIPTTREELKEGLKVHDFQVGVELTEDFYDDVNTGVNTPLTIYFSGANDMSKSVFKELLYAGIGFVRTTESSIYSVVDLRDTYALKMSVSDTEYFLSEYYMLSIFQRGSAFRDVVLSSTGEVNLTQYYIIVAVLFFLLMGSLLFGFLYKEDENEMLRALSLRGITPKMVSTVRILVLWIYAYVASVICYIAGCVACHAMGIMANRKHYLMNFSVVALLEMLVVTFAMAAFAHLIYSLAKTRVMGMLLMMGINLFMLVLSGGILPMAYFPRFMQQLGNVLPLHFWMDHLQRMFFAKSFGDDATSALLVALLIDLIFAVVCMAIATYVTERRLIGKRLFVRS